MAGPTRPASRYQRRILAWGLGLSVLLYVVGAPIYLDRVERDLTDRVSAALTDAGIDGVTVSFSGQTGTLRCTTPLSDPQEAVDLAYDVRGVHAVAELPDACRVRTADDDDASDAAATTAPSTATGDTAADGTAATSTTTIADHGDFDTVRSVLDGSPQFALLAQLVDEAGLGDELVGEGPLTFFAPTDVAFDVLPADGLAQLRSDPELLSRVLRHHLVADRLLLDDLVSGTLTSVDGGDLAVDDTGESVTVDAATIIDGDVLAGNGVVHAIDALLVPADVDLDAPLPASASVVYADGGFVFDGVVRSEVERAVINDAAAAAAPGAPISDGFVTDPDVGLDAAGTEALAALVAAMPGALVEGTAGFDGTALYLTGVFLDDAGRDAIAAAAAAAGVTPVLTPPPDATDDDAVDLEAELNAYVVANPILFAPTSAVLDESALPILDEVARRARAFAGVAITVEGHTDSDGSPSVNLALSQQRADAVRGALVERGLDADSITAQGFGSTRPVLVGGTEDKDASRRVEFRVVVGP